MGVRQMIARRGFTLVEILVVLGIVVILAALLFPVVAAARRKAHQVTCAQHERQLHVALMAYAEDHAEVLPPATTYMPGGRYSTPWQGQLNIVWWDLILPYARSESLLYCPGASDVLPSYHLNANLTWTKHPPLQACTEQSSTILLCDGVVPDGSGDAVWVPARIWLRYDTSPESFRHYGGVNCCFVDGHVKRLMPGDVDKESPLWDVVKTE